MWVVFVLATLSNDDYFSDQDHHVWVVFVLATLSNDDYFSDQDHHVWVVFVLATLSNIYDEETEKFLCGLYLF